MVDPSAPHAAAPHAAGRARTGSPPWLRFRFAVLGKARFLSHRDVARAWERALRRAALPMAWSEGFSPRPVISFGLALPVGAESLAEYLDIRLTEAIVVDGLVERLSPLLPLGMGVLAAADRPHGVGSLQQEVTSCCWELEVHGVSREELAARVDRVLASSSVPVARERKGVVTSDDLRPSILDLAVPDAEEPGRSYRLLSAELATKPRGVRPSELAAGLGAGVTLRRARRSQQWIDEGGSRREPVPLGTLYPTAVTVAEHASERAS
jgi:radical SAM-linked protein